MAVTLKTISYQPYLEVKKLDGAYVLTNKMHLDCIIAIDEKDHNATFDFRPGFKCDGLSVPFGFRWYLPKWDENNPLYNIAGMVHDWLYATKGQCIFSRSECDDIFRGILRESGISRCKAGMADWCVGVFAGGEMHWGNDDYGIKDLCKMSLK